jgi:HK97 family phage prohead protease
MKMQRKNFPVCAFKALDTAEGVIEAYVSVFGVVDHAKERVQPGFFKDSLSRKLPKGVWMHDWTLPVAKTLEAEEVLPGDPRLPEGIKQYGGLRIKGQFNLATQRGREAFSDLTFGTVDEFSFGYTVQESEHHAKEGVVDLLKGEIFEWSPVLVGCNPATVLVDVKEAPAEAGADQQAADEQPGEREAAADPVEPAEAETETKTGGLESGPPFDEHAEAVVSAAQAFIERARSRSTARAKEGRMLSGANRDRLLAACEAMREADRVLTEMLEQSAPKASPEAILQAQIRTQETLARLNGVAV